jgi:hypothetical protein
MSTKIKIYSERDIKRIVRDAVKQASFSYERILNSLKIKIIDLDRIVSMQDKARRRRWK